MTSARPAWHIRLGTVILGVVVTLAGVMARLAAVDARYFEIDNELGDSASGPEHTQWSPVLREFLDPLMAELA